MNFDVTLGISGSKVAFNIFVKIFWKKMKNLKIGDGTSLYFGIKKTLVNYKYEFSRSNPEITSFEKNRFLLSKIQVVKQKNFQIF